MKVEKQIPPCQFCQRKSVAWVRKKYPAKIPFAAYVCGYHLRPYRTSEYRKTPVKPIRITVGYAPVELLV